ncbi:MAG: right-handed parallel beta-helix repeat-containing protein [Paludibacter sp.]|nr:right-handed parallel beta-helix repeat-containing protein [Bacteroidales bacterium]MCM1069292.1 right-handed parallel beta-helix repeat-containing protein [Prevotella sp.]MCM1353725.1 right-handed parallel beta-helix repeat-containing protein [Bacteroides sp.]MCM1442207.1 right-handed parallel beta-helix repeat-containing protein [Muribaculum sp.]MCM1482169.1 right-handed parallel beta-helix repeat-containing protein [Paludibacter sp.]
MKRTLLYLIFSIGAVVVSATNYYASPTGSGNGKTYAKPCSFANGLKYITNPGDTLFLLGGQYDLANTKVQNKSGNKQANIVIAGYPGEKAILDFRTTAYGTRGLQIASSCSYLHVKDITLRYSGKNNLYNEGSYCTFENLDIYGSSDTGCQMKVGGNNLIINCDSHDNFDYQLGGTSAADFGGNADGFADKQHSGNPNTYIGCRAWNNSDDGWDFFQRVTSGTTLMQNCLCYNNGPKEYDMRNHPRYDTDKAWFDKFAVAQKITDADGNTITVSLQHYTNLGNGNGFKLGGGQTNHNVRLEHCLSVANTVRGFDQNNNFGTMTIYNCTGYNNKGGDFVFGNTNGGVLTIRNCLSYNTVADNSFRCSTTSDHNSWNTKGISVSAADFIGLDVTETLAERTQGGELPDIALMHLVEGSRLIDAGVDVGLAYAGKAPDLGCYEYGESVLPATLACTAGLLQQSVRAGRTIQPIVLTWGGAAEGVTYSNLPNGLTATLNNEAKTLTISGALSLQGQYDITVTTTGETDSKSLTITILVKSADAVAIAYVSVPESDADQLILQRLNANTQLSVDVVDAAVVNNYEPYDLVILSPVPNSTAAGLSVLKGINKPLIILKPFMFKNTVWNWGTPQNTSETHIRIMQSEHPLFKDLNTDSPELFSVANTNAVTCITAWNNSVVTELAQTMEGTGTCIAEAAAGTSMNGTMLTEKMLMIGLSEYSTVNLTDVALQLLENACAYMLDIVIPSAVENVIADMDVRQTAESLAVNDSNVTLMRLIGVDGQVVRQVAGNTISTTSLAAGVYVLEIHVGAATGCHKVIIH